MASTRPNSDSVLMEKPSSGKIRKRADERHGHRDHRDECGTPVLQEDVDDEHDQHQRDAQRDQNLSNPFGTGNVVSSE